MTPFSYSSNGWSADPDLVISQTQRRPQFNYEEDKVPPYELPPLLQAADAGPIATVEEWKRHREHLLDLFRHHVYGRSPEAPEELRFEVLEEDRQAMEGQATLRRVAVHSSAQDRAHTFELILFVPNHGQLPAPVFLFLNNRDATNTDATRKVRSEFWPAEEAIARGYAMAAFAVGEVAPIDPATFRDGIIRAFEGDAEVRPGDAWGALAAWAWGARRVMDYFETANDVDEGRVAVIGHSRGGKAALWTGAQDERFSLVISNQSGCGGAALSRRRFGETVEQINTGFPYWFCQNFRAFNGREDELPVDQHQLVALIAPRAVYIGSADRDLWADPRGEFLSLAYASPVFGLWGHPEISPKDMPPLDQPLLSGPRGYHVRTGGHNLTLWDWNAYMDLADQVIGAQRAIN
jgi:hypothetical protein